MPRVTTRNTMAPCVIIGEKAAEFLSGSRPCGGTSGSRRIVRACPDKSAAWTHDTRPRAI
jgi:choline dehydrogenase-like flavoprotein